MVDIFERRRAIARALSEKRLFGGGGVYISSNDYGVTVGFDKAKEAMKNMTSEREKTELKERIKAMTDEDLVVVVECIPSLILIEELERRLNEATNLKGQLKDITKQL